MMICLGCGRMTVKFISQTPTISMTTIPSDVERIREYMEDEDSEYTRPRIHLILDEIEAKARRLMDEIDRLKFDVLNKTKTKTKKKRSRNES